MNRFADLLDRLAYEPGRNNKLRLITDYFRSTGDPERGFALAALTGALSFRHAKPNVIRTLISERSDPVLFELSYDYVGDLSETVALMWPVERQGKPPLPLWERGRATARGEGPMLHLVEPPHLAPSAPPSPTRGEDFFAPSLSEVVTTLATLGKSELPRQLAAWLDALDETGRWALLKLVTGALRIGVSARLAKTAAAALGDKDPQEIELIWPGLEAALHRSVRLAGRSRRQAGEPRSHAVPAADAVACDRGSISPARCRRLRRRMEMGRHPGAGGRRRSTTTAPAVARLYSRTGEDISAAFPI